MPAHVSGEVVISFDFERISGSASNQYAVWIEDTDIAEWSKPGIALAARSQIMLYREDGYFAPQSVMTRGDAAIILYRVFSKVW